MSGFLFSITSPIFPNLNLAPLCELRFDKDTTKIIDW
jgi:hypothetical protein